MSRMLLIVLVIGSTALGSGPQKKKVEPQGAKKVEPLPPLNEKVVEFAKKNLGHPVGDGVCITLAVEALQVAGAKRYPFERSGDYLWGEEVTDFKDVLPGDILQFRDAVFKGKRSLGGGRTVTWHSEYPHHTAVVAKAERGGKLITIYHQNVATDGRPESEKGKVQEGELRMESLQKGGWIKAYRPVPASTTPRRPPPIEDEAADEGSKRVDPPVAPRSVSG